MSYEDADENERILEEPEEHETVDSVSDLKQEKHIKNKFQAEGNTAQQQVFIQNLNWSNQYQEQHQQKNYCVKAPKKYNLRDVRQCTEFIEAYGNSEYLAAAIILSTFEAVTLADFSDLQETLMKYLPTVEAPEHDETRETGATFSSLNPYISIDTIMAVIGGKRYVAKDGQICIGLGNDSKKALFHILEQFPRLRNAIVSWLIRVNETYQYQTYFDAYQITTAFARIASFDMTDAEQRIFIPLYSNPKNVGLLGNLICKLYKDMETKGDAENILMRWIHSESVWLWKPACLSYSFLTEDQVPVSFESDLRESICGKLMQFNRYDWSYISVLLMDSMVIRSVFADIFSDMYGRLKRRDEKELLAQKYINLIRRGYYRVSDSHMELPLVACDTQKQQESLRQIIAQVMSVYRLRKQLYIILEAYLNELSLYHFSERMVNHITAYFYLMASGDMSYPRDILFFLYKCDCIVSNQIYMKLQNMYKREGLYLHG